MQNQHAEINCKKKKSIAFLYANNELSEKEINNPVQKSIKKKM